MFYLVDGTGGRLAAGLAETVAGRLVEVVSAA